MDWVKIRKESIQLLKLSVQGTALFIKTVTPYLKKLVDYYTMSEEERKKVSKKDRQDVETTVYLFFLSLTILGVLIFTVVRHII